MRVASWNERVASWVRLFGLLCILGLAAYLRMGNAGVVEFKRDEANLSLLALDLVHGKHFPLLGIGSSVGIPNAPVNVYILAIPYFFSNSPIIATQFIGFLNVLAVGLVYWVGNRYYGYMAGIAAAGLFAASPWGVIFSRKIWAQNMLPVFVMLVIATGMLGFVERKRWAQIVFFPVLSITGQIHYGAFVIIPLSAYLLWQGWKFTTWKTICIGLFLAVLCTLPYLIGIYQADLTNLSRLSAIVNNDMATSSSSHSLITLEAVRGLRIIASGDEIYSLAGPEQFEDFIATSLGVFASFDVLTVLLLVSIGFWVFQLFIAQAQSTTVNCRILGIASLIGIMFPIVIYSIKWTNFYIHYLIPTLPLIYLTISTTINKTTNTTKTKILTITTLTILISLQTTTNLELISYIKTHNTPNGFGTPLLYLTPITEKLLQDNKPIIISKLTETEPTIWAALLYKNPPQFEDNNTIIYNQHPTNILSKTNNCTRETENLRPNEECYKLTRRNPLTTKNYINFPNPTTLSNGTKWNGWQWQKNNKCLTIWWEILTPTTKTQLFAVQFLNISNEPIESGDRIALTIQSWKPESEIASTFCQKTESTETTKIRLGMYTLNNSNIENNDFLDKLNNPTGQYIQLELENPQREAQ